jgi:hypothetical protein
MTPLNISLHKIRSPIHEGRKGTPSFEANKHTLGNPREISTGIQHSLALVGKYKKRMTS